jgi:hypothetical protein
MYEGILHVDYWMSDLVSDPLGRPPRFKPRRHKLGRLGLNERNLTAIGGDEQIDSVSPRFTTRP